MDSMDNKNDYSVQKQTKSHLVFIQTAFNKSAIQQSVKTLGDSDYLQKSPANHTGIQNTEKSGPMRSAAGTSVRKRLGTTGTAKQAYFFLLFWSWSNMNFYSPLYHANFDHLSPWVLSKDYDNFFYQNCDTLKLLEVKVGCNLCIECLKGTQ